MSDIKDFLKNLKLHESTISTVLGFLVIVVVGLLVVNYFRNLDTGETFPEGTQTEELVRDTYTVAEGDTLWSISEDIYGTGYNWVDLRDANEIENPNDLEAGTVLSIPEVGTRGVEDQLAEATLPSPTSSSEPVITPVPTQTPAPTQIAQAEPENTSEAVMSQEDHVINADAGSEYTVVKGDNLWDIAVAAYGDGYRWTDIANANDLVNPGLIHAGNVLIIPA